jgi:large subunit ribosomal protein L32
MPNPKHRHSRTRGRMRRAHDAIKPVSLSLCTHCNQPKMPHRVCPHCGYYKGQQIIEGKETL